MKLVNQISRTAGYTLAILFLLLCASTAAMAQGPANKYGFCHGLAGNPRVNNYTRTFALGPSSPPGALSGFLQHLHAKYDGFLTPELRCRMFATAAEAEAEHRKVLNEAAQSAAKWPPVEIDWLPEGGSALKGGAPAPEPAPAATAVKPTSAGLSNAAPAAPAALPAAPAKPAAAAGKPAAYVICRSEWNTDLRRFYNPPVDGLGAGYAEWQASYHAYLEKEHGFKGSNFGCSKYPTQEAAQAGYEAWVAAARSTPAVNGRNSPIVITNWKY